MNNDVVTKDISYIGARLREPSTFNAFALLLGLGGITIPDDLGKAIMMTLAGVGAIIGAALPEGK